MILTSTAIELMVLRGQLSDIDKQIESLKTKRQPIVDTIHRIERDETLAEYGLKVGDEIANTPELRNEIYQLFKLNTSKWSLPLYIEDVHKGERYVFIDLKLAESIDASGTIYMASPDTVVKARQTFLNRQLP